MPVFFAQFFILPAMSKPLKTYIHNPFGLFLFALLIVFIGAEAQTQLVKINKQWSMNAAVPPGNYSGITHISGSSYAVVSDKSLMDGFFVFDIRIDSVSGKVLSIDNLGFYGDSNLTGGDCEGIVFSPENNTFFISREADNSIVEFGRDGKATGRKLDIPPAFADARTNNGFEALTKEPSSGGLIWATTESTLSTDCPISTPRDKVRSRLRLQAFDPINLKPTVQYAYRMDAPTAAQSSSRLYAFGVSEMMAIKSGRLLILEREFFVPKGYVGSFVKCNVYEVNPLHGTPISFEDSLTDTSPYLEKTHVCQIETKLNLTSHSLANYEGMCLGPQLKDGSMVMIMVSDSQNRYHGVLKDWIKTIVIR